MEKESLPDTKVNNTNESVIEELTKDLDEHTIKEKPDIIKGTLKRTPTEPVQNHPEGIQSVPTEEDNPEDYFSDDTSDEEFEETELTEEEKLDRKDSAQKSKDEGNIFFKENEFAKSNRSYTKAIKTCPLVYTHERSIMFANRAACRMKMNPPKNELAIMDCSKALELNPNYLKALLRRAQLYRSMDKLDEALADYQRVLELDPNVLEAREAVYRLPSEITERNEKLKTEMMGKLKELGNMVLKPFGLSTNNFNLVQDPNTGGYSVNFQNN